MPNLKKIPKFKTEDEEIEFWDKHDTSEYYDLTKMERVIFPNLKRTVKTISIRLPESMINSLKYLSNSLDIPYQSLIKQYLSDTINKQLHLNNVATTSIQPLSMKNVVLRIGNTQKKVTKQKQSKQVVKK